MKREKWFNCLAIVGIIIALSFSIIITYVPGIVTQSKKETELTYQTEVFDKDSVMQVNIIMDKEDWQEMLDQAIEEEYYPCDIEINGTVYKNVGIRPKGNTSLTQIAQDDTTDRYSFKLEFDHYVDSQTCKGLDKMALNNIMSDSTYMKDFMSLDILSYLGVPTSLYSYASISVNGEYWGLYLAIEGIEESFLERNYGSATGQLYKPEINVGKGKNKDDAGGMMGDGQGDMHGNRPAMGQEQAGETTQQKEGQADDKSQEQGQMQPGGQHGMDGYNQGPGGKGGMESGGSSLVYTDDSIESYSAIFDSALFDASDTDYKKVIKALKNINNGTNLEEYVDVDTMLRYIAANVFLLNDDSYFGTMCHNYYLYEKDGQLTMLPWDYNLSFCSFQASSNVTDEVNRGIDSVVSSGELSSRPMIGKLLEVDEYKETYYKYLQELVQGYFDSGMFEQRIEANDALISEYVKTDPTAFYTYEEYKEGVSNLLQLGLLRAESITGQLNGTIPTTTEEQSKNSDTLIDASSISIEAMGTMGGGNPQQMKGGDVEKSKTNYDTSEKTTQDMEKQTENVEKESSSKEKSLATSKPETEDATSESNEKKETKESGPGGMQMENGYMPQPGNGEEMRPMQEGGNNEFQTVVYVVTGAAVIIMCLAIWVLTKYKKRKF